MSVQIQQMKSSPSSNFIFNATFQFYSVCQIFLTFHFMPVWQRSQRRACMIFIYPMMIFVSHIQKGSHYVSILIPSLNSSLSQMFKFKPFPLHIPTFVVFSFIEIFFHLISALLQEIYFHIYYIFCVTSFSTQYQCDGSSLLRLSNSTPVGHPAYRGVY